MRNSKTHAALAALIPLSLLLIPCGSVAQVTIKERVEIDKTSVATDSAAKSETVVYSLIPEYDGSLVVYYVSGSKFTAQISTDAVVHVFGDQLELVTDSLLQKKRLKLTTSPDITSNCAPYGGTDYRYAPGDSALWNVGHVEKGDEIKFSYDGQTYPNYGTSYEQNIPPEVGAPWEITLGLLNCPAPVVWDEYVFLNAAVTRDTLTLEINDQKEVWPSIPTRPKTPLATTWHSQIIGEVDNTLSPITATVTENGSPVDSIEVELAMAWVDTSGGHVHAQGVPHLSGSSLGSLTLLAGTFISSTDSTIVATTDQNGEVSVSYTAGEFGGQVAFTASATIASNLVTDEDTVTVKVPDLMMLPDVAQTLYKKLGGTKNHPGPDDHEFGGGYLHDPDYNHWARPDVVSQLQAIVSDWNSREDSVLYLNDMSLQNGGHFDIDGIWTGDHNSHRVGRGVDIKSTKWSSGVTGVYVAPDTLEDGSPVMFAEGESIGNRGFEQIVLQNCGKIWPEHDRGHYHIRFYPDSMNNCE